MEGMSDKRAPGEVAGYEAGDGKESWTHMVVRFYLHEAS